MSEQDKDGETPAAANDAGPEAEGPTAEDMAIEDAIAAAELEDAEDDNEDETAAEADPEAEIADLKDKLLRALADMENLRRRAQKDREDALKYSAANFARDMLSVGDLQRLLMGDTARVQKKLGGRGNGGGGGGARGGGRGGGGGGGKRKARAKARAKAKAKAGPTTGGGEGVGGRRYDRVASSGYGRGGAGSRTRR